MNDRYFYIGVLDELEKIALEGSTQVAAAGPSKPASGPSIAARATNASAGGMNNRANALQAGRSSQPTPNATPPLFPKNRDDLPWLARTGAYWTPRSVIDTNIRESFSSMKPGEKMPALSDYQKAAITGKSLGTFNSELGRYGANQIKNTSVFDANKSLHFEPGSTEQQVKEYGLGTPEVKGRWSQEVQDKTLGLGSLDDKGELGFNKDFNISEFLKNHWGKLLLGAGGLTLLGGLSGRGGEQQPIVINNNMGQPAMQAARSQAAPSYY